MAHFRYHLPGGQLVHGYPGGISQAGVSNPLAERVYVSGGPAETEIRTRAAVPAGIPTVDAQSVPFTGSASASIAGIVGPFIPDIIDFVGDIFGGDDDAIPGNPTASNEGGPCVFPFRTDPVTGECKLFVGETVGPDVRGVSMHADGHADTMPTTISRRVRRCRRGSVLGKDGWCHPRRDIRNADREWPKARRPLGTPGDLNAVTKAKAFSTRLVNNQKSLKKTAANFAKAAQYYRTSPGKSPR